MVGEFTHELLMPLRWKNAGSDYRLFMPQSASTNSAAALLPLSWRALTSEEYKQRTCV